MNIFVGRQPILDIDENIFGYELLYRNSKQNYYPDVDQDDATIGLIVNTFLSIGVDKVNNEGLSFINFTGNLLAQDIFDSLDPEYVVIEILENVEITPALISRVRSLREKGFKIAMDDFILQEQYERHLSLFNYIDYIKIDFFETTLKERLRIEQFSKQYQQIMLIAEKVETLEDYKYARASGYTLFQGYYFAKPEIIEGYEIPSKMHLYFQIIEKLNSEEPNIDEIAEFIKRDVSLSYKLLRFINTPGVGVPRKISSINQAIVVIGLNEMGKWMHVLALHDLRENAESGRVNALIEYSLARAKMCELLARKSGKKNIEEYFLVGMFSLMNVIMRKNWVEVLPLLPLSDKVSQTLEGLETEMTPYLELASAIERFDWERVEKNIEFVDISYEELSAFSQQAIQWTRKLR